MASCNGAGASVGALGSDGGTGGDPGDEVMQSASTPVCRRNSVQLLHSHSLYKSEGSGMSPHGRPMGRRDSQCFFSKQEQTVIVFDWDDTLFPTTYVNDDLRLDWQRSLRNQPNLQPEDVESVMKKLSLCEEGAAEALRRARELAHVVVVTLASTGWVHLACKHFYPAIGKLLSAMEIPIVYAQEKAGVTDTQYDKLQFQSSAEVERFWGLVKGHAISEEVERFYSRYEGQSWKNVLSIGDSSFERYGLLAATSAYMQGRRLGGVTDAPVWSPTQEGCWQKVQDGHVKKLRAKCCKLVDQPDVSELTVELEMVTRWLEGMVQLDAGFDLDLESVEDEGQVGVIEAVLAGERPVSDLPRPVGLQEGDAAPNMGAED